MLNLKKLGAKLLRSDSIETPTETANVEYKDQVLGMFNDKDRHLTITPPSFNDVSPDRIISVVSAARRQHKIKPFTLIDPEKSSTPIIQKYAAGRVETRDHSYVSFVKNLRVSGTGLLVTKQDEVLPESCIRPHHAFYSDDRQHVTIRHTEPVDKVVKTVAEPTIILIGVFPLHFSHWTYDNYARLCFARRVLGDLKGYKIAVGFGNRRGGWCKPNSYQYECLSFLGIPHEDVIMLHEKKWTEFEKAVVLSEVNEYKQPTQNICNAPEIFEFFDDVYTMAGLERRPAKNRVHLSRIDDQNRKCVNEQLVINDMQKYGFEEKVIAGMTMREQMQYFSDIDIACGPAGNNLITMCFMQPGSKLVTYFPPQASHFIAYYQSYCSSLGVDLYAICGSKFWWDGPKNSLDNLRWEVDPDLVNKVIEQIT